MPHGYSYRRCAEIDLRSWCQRGQLSEFVTLIPYIADTTELPKLAADMVNTKVHLSALSSPTPPECSL